MPLQHYVVGELKEWRKRSLYDRDDDFIFPSALKNGSQPVSPDMILRRHIRPAAVKAGITKSISWHSFRRGYSIMLLQMGVDVKTAQELMRHANPRITQAIYQEAVSKERRVGQRLAFDHMMTGPEQSNPSEPSEAR